MTLNFEFQINGFQCFNFTYLEEGELVFKKKAAKTSVEKLGWKSLHD